jgi:hypothetical protein
MDTILHLLSRGIDELLGRFSGPLNFRLFVMPTVVTILAIRADLRDAREGMPASLGAFLRNPIERQRLLRSAIKDIGKVFLVAIVLDTTYQLWVLKSFHLGQLLIVAIVCAIVPYVLVRGPITRLGRLVYRQWSTPNKASVSGVATNTPVRK